MKETESNAGYMTQTLILITEYIDIDIDKP